jgi:hypothetical protein
MLPPFLFIIIYEQYMYIVTLSPKFAIRFFASYNITNTVSSSKKVRGLQYHSRVRGLPRLPTDQHAPLVLCIKWICRGGARPLRRSYLDQQWRTQYVIGKRIQYLLYKGVVHLAAVLCGRSTTKRTPARSQHFVGGISAKKIMHTRA